MGGSRTWRQVALFWSQVGLKLGPCWTKLTQVGPMLRPRWIEKVQLGDLEPMYKIRKLRQSRALFLPPSSARIIRCYTNTLLHRRSLQNFDFFAKSKSNNASVSFPYDPGRFNAANDQRLSAHFRTAASLVQCTKKQKTEDLNMLVLLQMMVLRHWSDVEVPTKPERPTWRCLSCHHAFHQLGLNNNMP